MASATVIETIYGDITSLDVDVIVNATNTSLGGGSGVDGAIHNVAGPQLAKECKKLNGCEFGEAKLTKAYKLPAKFVIHTVGPVYGAHDGDEPEILYSCYYESLRLADSHHLKSIAFPKISTGAFGYPKDEASKIARNAVDDFVEDYTATSIQKVLFVIFTK